MAVSRIHCIELCDDQNGVQSQYVLKTLYEREQGGPEVTSFGWVLKAKVLKLAKRSDWYQSIGEMTKLKL